MPKLKTHKATAKRFRYTGGKKIMRRRAGQDHFNSREPGSVTTRKRLDETAPHTHERTIRTLTPYR